MRDDIVFYIVMSVLITAIVFGLAVIIRLVLDAIQGRRLRLRPSVGVFLYSQQHADSLIQEARLMGRGVGKRIAGLEDGTFRPYTVMVKTLVGEKVYRLHFQDAVTLGTGTDMGTFGYWR